VLLTKSEHDKFAEKAQFKKLFVFKGFQEVYVHYFNSRYLKGGPCNGSKPKAIEQPVRSKSLVVYEPTRAIEERLASLEFEEPQGDVEAHRRNLSKFAAALKPILNKTFLADSLGCSEFCRGEDAKDWYIMVDESRFQLACGHFSKHLQCIVSFVYKDAFAGYAYCPISDKQDCVWPRPPIQGGVNFYWGKQDYFNCIKAFLRNEALV